MKRRRFQFGPFDLDADNQLLRHDGKPIALAPKAFETLLYLLENPSRLVTRDELIKAIWPNSFVEDGSLSVNISLIRRALGEQADGEPYIETVPRKGYRFRSEVNEFSPAPGSDGEESTSEERRAVLAGSSLLQSFPVAQARDHTGFASGGEDRAFDAVEALDLTLLRSEQQAPKSHRWNTRRSIAAIGIVSAALLGTLLVRSIKNSRPSNLTSFASMKISPLAWGSQMAEVAISPNGKYVAYVSNELRGQSLWIRQLDVTGSIRLIAPEDAKYASMTFSPDGDFLYYSKENQEHVQALYRMPFLGGDSTELVSGLSGPIAFSPDGSKLAFLRVDPASWEASLMVADANGSGLHRVAGRTRPRYFSPTGLAWLPGGRSIACFAGDAAQYGAHAFHVVKISVADGAEAAVTSQTWSWAGAIQSPTDGNSLLVTASEQAQRALQVWRISLRDGSVSRVTNDLENYAQLSSASNGKTLAAIQVDRLGELWLAPVSDPSFAAPLAASDLHGINDLTWTPDGSIAFSVRLGDYFRIFTVDTEGQALKQLTLESGDKTESAFTADGRYVIYQASGKIWRLNRDGTNPRQLTFGAHDVHPAPSPDSQTVLYASFVKWSPAIGGKPTLWSVPIDGGTPTQLTTTATSFPQISPDGKLIAAAYYPGADPRFSRNEIAVFSRSGGQPIQTFERALPSEGDSVYWAPDSKSIDYSGKKAGVGNIWRQPLHGRPAFPLTHFSSNQIFDFAWSFDGRQLVLARGKTISRVVVIKGVE